MRICQHDFPTPSSACLHCGCRPDKAEGSCIFRDMPRATPSSIFAGNINHIGEEMRTIMTREGRPLPPEKEEEQTK